jgi:hypothetical protein
LQNKVPFKYKERHIVRCEEMEHYELAALMGGLAAVDFGLASISGSPIRAVDIGVGGFGATVSLISALRGHAQEVKEALMALKRA